MKLDMYQIIECIQYKQVSKKKKFSESDLSFIIIIMTDNMKTMVFLMNIIVSQ